MRVFPVVHLIVIMALHCDGQINVDSLYAIVRHDSRGDILAIDSNEVIVIGSARDESTSAVGIAYSRFTLTGDLLLSSYEYDSLVYFISANEIVVDDTIVYVAPHMSWPPRYLLKFNRESGEILAKIELPTIDTEKPIVVPQALSRLDSTRLVFSSLLKSPTTYNETQITTFNMRDASMKHLRNGFSGFHQNMNFIEWKNDRIWLAGDLVRGDPYDMGFLQKLSIVVLDTFGNELHRYVSIGLRGFTSNGIIEGNGDIVIAHSFYKNYFVDPWWVPACRPGVSRINIETGVVWETPLGFNHYCDDAFDNKIKAMIRSEEGDGYILAGAQSNFSVEQFYDTLPDIFPNGENFQDNALIAKVSTVGQIIWQRTYSKADKIYSFDRFGDIVVHPEGGYLLSGTVAELNPGEPLVRTWLLYVDEYGCAVPGCHLVSTVDDQEDATLPFLVYPNPASSDLYVYQAEDENCQYQVFNLQGQQLDLFQGSRGGHTFIVDVSAYASGTYILSRTDSKGRTVSEKWVKQ